MSLKQPNNTSEKAIRISDEVIASITAIAIQDVNGAVGVTTASKLESKNILRSVSTEMKDGGIIVNTDVVVEYGGHTKVVSYFCVAYVIPVTEEFSDVVVYYSTTNGDGKDESYANCSPLTIKAEPGKFIDYIKTL